MVGEDGEQIGIKSTDEAREYGFVDHVVSKAAMTDSTNPVTDN